MLERVALNQALFRVPGLAPDGRGIALGSKLALLFPSVDKLVGFFRLYSEQASIDDLLPTLHLYPVRTALSGHELLAVLGVDSSYFADRAARLGRLSSGLVFTGSGKHFVQYRDEASPLGYDVVEADPGEGDFVLYADSFTQAYRRGGELPFSQLVFRLELICVPGPLDLEGEEVLYATAPRGLGRALLRYLWRNRVDCAAAAWEPQPGASDAPRPAWLLRITRIPARMLDLFRGVPGVTLYRPLGETFAVEVGFRHPLHLESCATVFDREGFTLFGGISRRVDVLPGPIELVPGATFIGPTWELGADRREVAPSPPRAPASLEVPLHLVPSTAQTRRVAATLIPAAQLGWLKRLVYLLPPTALRGHRVAWARQWVVVLAAGVLDAIPLGMGMQELATGLYLPLGFELRPAVSPEIIAERVGAGAERMVFFCPGEEGPWAVAASAFVSLERRALAEIPVDMPPAERLARPAAAPPELGYTDVELFSLWRFRGTRRKPT